MSPICKWGETIIIAKYIFPKLKKGLLPDTKGQLYKYDSASDLMTRDYPRQYH